MQDCGKDDRSVGGTWPEPIGEAAEPAWSGAHLAQAGKTAQRGQLDWPSRSRPPNPTARGLSGAQPTGASERAEEGICGAA